VYEQATQFTRLGAGIMHKLLRVAGLSRGVEGAAEVIGAYPPMLIIKKEDKEITNRGLKHTGAPEEHIRTFAFPASRYDRLDFLPLPTLKHANVVSNERWFCSR
jgi:hypothetical protein